MIRLDGVAKQHGKQILFADASLAIFPGDKIGLVGPNGSGKSTIFRMIMKSEAPDAGSVSIDRGTTIGYFDQNVGEMSGMTVLAAVLAGAGGASEVGEKLKELEVRMGNLGPDDDWDAVLAEFGEAQARFESLGGYGLEARAQEILAGLGFAPEQVAGDVGALSGGWKMRVALCRILLMQPDVMLLDEPTNHLDIESILWLEGFLKETRSALMMTCHDREFMNRIVGKIVEIDGGEVTQFGGDYEFYVQQRAILDAQRESQFERQQAMLAKEEAFIARFAARASHAAQVQSRVKKLDKIERFEPPKRRRKMRFEFPDAPRSGDDVVKLQGVHKRYGEKIIYEGFDLLIRRQERWCVMGVNGAGKSTLLKLVAGAVEADSGDVVVGGSTRLGYFAQHSMEVLDPNKTVWETLMDAFPLASQGSLRTLAGVFGFSGDEADKSCSILSGGEKARVVLAKMLYNPPNFLVLDEPTNHLDLDTKEMLLEALRDYTGTLLFVSHDRQFLKELSTRVLELDGRKVTQYGGGYREYVEATGYEAPGVHS